jgi:hypothetical protein
MMHAYAYANANAMQLRTKHLKCYKDELYTKVVVLFEIYNLLVQTF